MKQKVLLGLVLSLIACLLVSTSVLGAYSGYYQIRNARDTQMFIDGMGRTDNGADLCMWANTTHYNSHWQIIDVGGGYYQLKCRSTGMFIDGMGRSNSGDPCGQWANTTHYNSHWKISSDKGYVRFQNRETGRYLDSNGQTANGAFVVQRSGRSDLAQRWTIISVGGTAPTPPPGPTATPKPGPTATPKPAPTPTSGGGGGPVPSGLVGFATLNGGTTGGQGGTTVTVNTGTALQAEIKKGGPRIIRVNGTINTSNSSGLSKIDVKDVNNITIIGVGTSGEFNGIGIKVTRANNIIIRNLRIHHVRTGDKDCISIEGPVNNIWVDHCELYNQFQGVDKDYYDALLDTKKNAAYHTFSWNKLHDSWKASLAGSSESDTSDRRVTYHHNSFININSRLPLYRGGQGHVYNNHYKDVPTTAVNSRINAKLRVEYNYFENVNNCIGSWDSDVIGYWHVVNNVFSNCTGSQPTTSTCSYNPPYSYSVESTSTVRSTISNNAGVGKI